MSCEMLASTEDHATLAVAPALKGLGRGGAITLANTGDTSADARRVMGYHCGGHVGGGLGMLVWGGVVELVDVVVGGVFAIVGCGVRRGRARLDIQLFRGAFQVHRRRDKSSLF
jgi:hypothetical protein